MKKSSRSTKTAVPDNTQIHKMDIPLAEVGMRLRIGAAEERMQTLAIVSEELVPFARVEFETFD